jgi:hypothetical protein
MIIDLGAPGFRVLDVAPINEQNFYGHGPLLTKANNSGKGKILR